MKQRTGPAQYHVHQKHGLVRPQFFIVLISLPTFIRIFIRQIQQVNERTRDNDLRLSTQVRKSPHPVGQELLLLSTIHFQETIFRCALPNVNMTPTPRLPSFLLKQGLRLRHRHRRRMDTVRTAMGVLSMGRPNARRAQLRG